MRHHLIWAAALLALGGCGANDADTGNNAAAPAVANSADAPGGTITDSIGDAADLSTAKALISQAALDTMLDGAGSYTLFVPTDDAFKAVDADTMATLKTDDGKPQLIALLSQHIVPGYVAQADLKSGLARNKGQSEMASMGGSPLVFHQSGDTVSIGDGDAAAKIVGDAIASRNGVIYRIDKVIPPAAE